MKKGEVDVELEGFYVYGWSPRCLGKGSSAKIESMNLGILVIIFPTVYEGELVVFHEEKKWS